MGTPYDAPGAETRDKSPPKRNWTLILLGGFAALVALVLVAATALPAFGDYSARAKMSEAQLAMFSYREGIVDYYATHRKLPKSASDAGIEDWVSTSPSDKVARITWVPALSELHARVKAVPGAEGTTIKLRAMPQGDVLTWTCYSDDEAARKLLPSTCRGKP